MDNNNWRPTQSDPNMVDTPDWRTQLQADSRQRIVNKIMDTLKRHLPISGPEGLIELKKIAVRFEEKIYTAATSQTDYLRKISLKMLTMETKSQNTGVANALPQNSVGNQNPADPGTHSMQSQVRNQGQPQISLANQPQARQQLLSQGIQDTNASSVIQSSNGLPSALPSVTGLTPSSMTSAIGQSSNLQGISGISQNSVGQGGQSNIFTNQQRQMQGRQHPQQVVSQGNQQQPPNSQQYMYQHHPNQILKQKLQQGNIQPSLMQSHMQQQNLLQATQLQSSQQSLMQMSSNLQSNQATQQTQPSMMQSGSHSGFQQNQQPSVQQSTSAVLQQHPQSVMRQQPQSQQSLHQQSSGLHQPQTSIPQQQQHQTLAGQQQNTVNIQQQNQLIGQQNNVSDLQSQQQLQQQQRLLGQQNSLSNMQQQQQQLLGQQNNVSNLNQQQQQQLGSQNGIGLQQQQLVGSQSGVSNMQSHQPSLHMLSQQAKVGGQQQQSSQTSSSLMQMPGQQSQSQPLQQQMLPQLQSQPTQFQQQLGLQHQVPLQRDMQQRLNSSGIQPQNVIEQKQIQSQRMLSEASSTSIDSTSQSGQANGGDWQEEAYQKIKTMKETYLPDLNEMYQKVCLRLQQHESLAQLPKEQIERLKMMKLFLERVLAFLQGPKSSISLSHRDKMGSYEKQIVAFLTSNRVKKPLPSPKGSCNSVTTRSGKEVLEPEMPREESSSQEDKSFKEVEQELSKSKDESDEKSQHSKEGKEPLKSKSGPIPYRPLVTYSQRLVTTSWISNLANYKIS